MVSPKLASALKKAQRLGRGGDTMLAHINPQEADILKKLGGSGSVNPHTGLHEFDNPSMGDYGGGGYGVGQSSGPTAYSGSSGSWNSPSPSYGGGGSGYRTAAAIDAATNNYGGGSYGVGGSLGPSPNSGSGASYGGSWNSPSTYSGGTSVSNTSLSRSPTSSATSFGSALDAGAGIAKDTLSSIGSAAMSLGDTLNGWIGAAQPTVNSLGNTVGTTLGEASDALNSGIADGYSYAKNFISQALEARDQPSYTQYASGGVGAPGSDYGMPNMGPPGLRSEAANGGYDAPAAEAPSAPQAPAKDYLGNMMDQSAPFGGAEIMSPFVGTPLGLPPVSHAQMLSALGIGGADSPAAGASPASGTVGVPGPGYSGPKGVGALNQAAQDAYAMTNTTPTYSGPKGIPSKGLNDAAWAAGGGMTVDQGAAQALKQKFGVVPVGIRTNNPGNILDGKFAREQPGYTGPYTSPNGLTYATFSRPDYGMMAQQELISGPNYFGAGKDTVAKIIDKYAPVDQNNSVAANAAYKQYVASQLGVGINDKLSEDQVKAMTPAQIAFELGGNPYNYGPVGPTATMMATNGSGFALPGGGYAVAMNTSSPAADPNAQVQGGSGNYLGQVGTDFAHSYQLDSGALVADIKQTVPGASWLSDSSIMDRVAAAVPDGVTIDPKTGQMSIGDVNKDGTVDAKDVASVVEGFKKATGIDASKYASAIPPAAPKVDYNVSMGTQYAFASPADAPAQNATTVADVPPQVLPARPVTPTPESAYGFTNPNVYASPLTLPAQPEKALGTAFDVGFGLTPLGIPNAIAGLFGYSVGDQIANRANIPMTPEEALAAENRLYSQGEGKGSRSNGPTQTTSIAPPSQIINDIKTKVAMDTGWKKAALAHGYTEAQLSDPKVAALIKQIYDMGLIPKLA